MARQANGLLLSVALVVGACAEATNATTTQGTQSTTTVAATTTDVPTTTSSPAPTTLGSTTTTSSVEGNWANVPLVTSNYGALGWWDGTEWIRVDADTTLPVDGGESYQVALFGSAAVVTAVGQAVYCDWSVPAPLVTFADASQLGALPGLQGVAISAPWDLTPHLVEEFDDDGTYAGFASDLLDERGLEVDNPVIKQLYRLDIEGDGVLETITVAETTDNPGLEELPDHYSIMFLRRVVQGEAETTVIAQSLPNDGSIAMTYSLAALADLNGDGNLEMVVDSGYYEGSGVSVYEYVEGSGAIQRIGAGCGV